ncbi:putative diacylglycerol O-acyltransferase tgs1 [Cryptotrichosporon argae]
MPGRRKPQSVFTALPHEIRQRIRSQTADAWVDDTAGSSSAASPAASTSTAHLLPTQPPSPDSATSSSIPEVSMAYTQTQTPTSAVVAVPAPFRAVVKAIKRAEPWARQPESERPSKRRKSKGKGRADDAHNTFFGHPWDCTGLVARYTDVSEVPASLQKYWWQRHRLFPRYSDLPLLLDDVGWFSVTPQAIAAHIADRCRADVVLDAFCGVGGNAIEFARTCERVIAMDNDPTRLRLARHNALHHGVADRIEFVLCDYVDFARSFAPPSSPLPLGDGAAAGPSLAAPRHEAIDVVFLSPPWGGPEYLASSTYYPLAAVEPVHGADLFRLTARITPNIAYYLPRNVDVAEVGALASEVQDGTTQATEGEAGGGAEGETKREWCEVEEQWVGAKLKAVTVYYGGLVEEE